MAIGQLKVKVLNGRDLKNRETFQTSDPYCVLQLGSTTFQTKHVSSNLNPDWNEEFVFDVEEGQEVLALSIFDKNSIKKDVFMGFSFVSFDSCVKDKETEKAAEVLGDCSGIIHVVLSPNFETRATIVGQLKEEAVKNTGMNMEEKQKITELQEELEKVKKEKEGIQKNAETLSNKVKELEKLAAKDQVDNATDIATHEALEDEINTLKKNNADLTEKLKSAEEKLEAVQLEKKTEAAEEKKEDELLMSENADLKKKIEQQAAKIGELTVKLTENKTEESTASEKTTDTASEKNGDEAVKETSEKVEEKAGEKAEGKSSKENDLQKTIDVLTNDFNELQRKKVALEVEMSQKVSYIMALLILIVALVVTLIYKY